MLGVSGAEAAAELPDPPPSLPPEGAEDGEEVARVESSPLTVAVGGGEVSPTTSTSSMLLAFPA